MKSFMVALLILGVAFGYQAPAVAATCDTPANFNEALERADSVFVARVISVSDGGVSAVAAVEAVWKGPDLEDTVNLDGGDSSDKVSGLTRTHSVGQRLLVVAAWSRRVFNDDGCTATRPFTGSATDIPVPMQAALGTDQARVPIAAESVEAGSEGSEFPVRSVALGGLVLVLILVGIFLVRRAVAFRPELDERDFAPNQVAAKPDLPPVPQRRVAGWMSGRFSRSGRDQLARLKGDRKR
jgi:hypothetical protein